MAIKLYFGFKGDIYDPVNNYVEDTKINVSIKN